MRAARAVILAEETEAVRQLATMLAASGFEPVITDAATLTDRLAADPPELVIVQAESRIGSIALVQSLRREHGLPTIGLVPGDVLRHPAGVPDCDDFVLMPCDPREVVLRARRLLRQTVTDGPDTIRCGELAIDTAGCEVTVAGELVMLTFREYELLKFLASNPGRVFTREDLLDRVWGHDYFGGDRTVDVHVRRLRAKIEGYGRTYIDTIRSIGYAFRTDTAAGGMAIRNLDVTAAKYPGNTPPLS
jgi:DNA-binding response OmpR family regulator